jgi:polar amino acid transport system permease protein
MVKRPSPKVWPWHILTLAILLILAGSLWIATNKIDYTWRWNRVPQYFFYSAKTVQTSPFDGTVSSIKVDGGLSIVQLESDAGEKQTFKVETPTLRYVQGETIYEAANIGSTSEWKAGPLVTGLGMTLWLSLTASILGLLIGLVTGLCRISKNPTLRGLSSTYVELIRGTPLLVQIFIFYFFLGTVLDIGRVVSGISALAIFAGAYVAEIIRAGIQSIPKGQTEAARSLGMTAMQNMIYIVLPQAFKRVLPPLAGQFISLIKDSSLVSVIAITDLTKSGREVITSTFATFEIWFTVALLYLLLTSVLSQLIAWVERRLAFSD